VREGELVVAEGVRLTAARLGAIAAAGVGTVSVSRAPRVAVVSTGSELRPAGEPLVAGRSPSRTVCCFLSTGDFL